MDSELLGPERHQGNETHLLKEIFLVGQAMREAFASQIGMPPARFALFRAVALNDGKAVGTMDLSRLLNINAAAVTRQIKELVDLGYLAKEGSQTDARRATVKLTDQGKAAFFEFHERMHRLESRLLMGIPKDQADAAAEVLRMARNHLEKINAERLRSLEI